MYVKCIHFLRFLILIFLIFYVYFLNYHVSKQNIKDDFLESFGSISPSVKKSYRSFNTCYSCSIFLIFLREVPRTPSVLLRSIPYPQTSPEGLAPPFRTLDTPMTVIHFCDSFKINRVFVTPFKIVFDIDNK